MSDETKVVRENQQTPQVDSRAHDISSGGDAPITVNLLTIDTVILNHLSNRIRPVVTQGGAQVRIPVIYGNPERWKSVQKDGVLRDSIGKIQLPLIMIRRSSMKKTPMTSAVNQHMERTFSTGWNRRNPYDQFAAINKITPSREYYNTVGSPDYYAFSYKCMIWTEFTEQMNGVIENISFESDEYWGEQNGYKFRTSIKSFENLTELPVDSDRVVRTEFEMVVSGYLLAPTMLDNNLNRGLVTRKRYGVKKLVTFVEVDG